MIYLLDTNTCIGYLRGRLQVLVLADAVVCLIVKAELISDLKYV
jgi:predicted nucleic acid-binding protein